MTAVVRKGEFKHVADEMFNPFAVLAHRYLHHDIVYMVPICKACSPHYVQVLEHITFKVLHHRSRNFFILEYYDPKGCGTVMTMLYKD